MVHGDGVSNFVVGRSGSPNPDPPAAVIPPLLCFLKKIIVLRTFSHMNKDIIYLIDGSAYLYRAFHAIRNLSNSRGLPTNATFGFTRMLLKLIKEKSPRYMGMFFDVKGPTFRHEIYDQYKANRPPMPEDMAVQIPWIKKVVAALGIPIIEKKGYEADDLIGTCAGQAENQGVNVVMVTGDKDFMQLVTDHCIIHDPMKDKTIDRQAILSEFNLDPPQIIDMLGLAGDTSDNIPGVPGVGPKTAMKLLAAYGSIQGIYDHLADLEKKKALHKKLSDHQEQALLSRRLVTIDRHVDIPFDLGEFKAAEPDRNALAALFRELEFRQLLDEFSPAPEPVQKHYSLPDRSPRDQGKTATAESRRPVRHRHRDHLPAPHAGQTGGNLLFP